MDTNKTKPASGAARLAAVGGAPLARVLKVALTHTVTHTTKCVERLKEYRREGKMNCTPFVRQYDILSKKWGAVQFW